MFVTCVGGASGMAVASATSMNRLLRLACAMLAIAISLACEAQPRQRPLDVGPVASGPGTIEFERRRLQGTWGLERFEVFDSAGKPTPRTRGSDPHVRRVWKPHRPREAAGADAWGEKSRDCAARLLGPDRGRPEAATVSPRCGECICRANRSGARKQD